MLLESDLTDPAYFIPLSAHPPQNGQTHSNDLSAKLSFLTPWYMYTSVLAGKKC